MISFHWMTNFQCDWCLSLCRLNLFYSSLRWGGGSWLCCGYYYPRGWFHRAGVGLLANCRVVLGTWPPLAMNVVNFLISGTVWLTHCRTKCSFMRYYQMILPSESFITKLAISNSVLCCLISFSPIFHFPDRFVLLSFCMQPFIISRLSILLSCLFPFFVNIWI